MSKYLVFKKESYGLSYTKTEHESLEDIVEKNNGNLENVIIAKEVKIKLVEDDKPAATPAPTQGDA